MTHRGTTLIASAVSSCPLGGGLLGRVLPAGRRHLTVRRPAGEVASLSPWNFPCSIQARKVAPALAAGCAVVARVCEKAPLAVTDRLRCLVGADLDAAVDGALLAKFRNTGQSCVAADRFLVQEGSTRSSSAASPRGSMP